MTVDYIPYATGGGAVVMSQPNYITDAPNGVSTGLADPTFANKSWRQSSMIAAAVANFIANTLGINVLDDGNLSVLITNLTAALQVAGASGYSQGMGVPTNLAIAASVGSNQLTVSLVGTNLAAPSATNPIGIAFRDPTIANGEVVPRTVTAATSITLNSGSTMGVANNNQPFRLWCVAFDNAGTVCVALINCSTLTEVFALVEDVPQTSQSGTVGGNTAGLFYANVSAITAKSVRILGYLEWASGLAAVGVWAAGPTTIQLFGPGQRKPGDVVQMNYSASASVSITPTSKANLVKFSAFASYTLSSGVSGTIALKRASTTILTQGLANGATSTTIMVAGGVVLDTPGAASSTAYTINNTLGSLSQESLLVEEIMG